MPTDSAPGRARRAAPDIRHHRGWLAFAALAALILGGCDRPLTVEQQVIAVIRDMEARLEAVERRPFMSHVAEDFSAQDGNMSREQFNAMVLAYLHRYKRVQAQFLPIHVTTQGQSGAIARFRVLLTGGERWLPERGRMYQVETRWRREDSAWLLADARWEPVDLEDWLD